MSILCRNYVVSPLKFSTEILGKKELARLNQAAAPDDMRLPGWDLHPLKGDMAGHWLVKLNGNWRVTFKFEVTDAVAVDYTDYH